MSRIAPYWNSPTLPYRSILKCSFSGPRKPWNCSPLPHPTGYELKARTLQNPELFQIFAMLFRWDLRLSYIRGLCLLSVCCAMEVWPSFEHLPIVRSWWNCYGRCILVNLISGHSRRVSSTQGHRAQKHAIFGHFFKLF